MTQISNIGINYTLTAGLQNEMAYLETLNQQLASGKQHSNLTNYAPNDASQIVNFQNSITQRQSYLSSIQTVQNRLTIYNSTMSDMETIASNAAGLAAGNQSYNAATASNIQAEAQNYLHQVADDLNQQVSGRYIYAGLRYNTQPVSNNPTTLNNTPQSIITDNTTLPDYDTERPAVATKNATYGAALPGTQGGGYTAPTSTVQVYDASGTSHDLNYTWSNTGSTPPQWDLAVSSPDATYTTVIPFTFDSSTGTLSSISDYSSSASAPSPYSVGLPTGTGEAADVSLSMTFPGQTSPQSISLDFGSYGLAAGNNALTISSTGTTVSQNTFTQDGKAITATNPEAYTADSALIDANNSLSYGLSSNDPSFQRLINGLRYINAAVTAGNSGDTATYQSYMQLGSSMLNKALTGIQTLNADVANNQNALSQEVTNQNSNITLLQNNLGTIQNADTTQVATALTILQSQMEASYSATASLEKLSLVSYL